MMTLAEIVNGHGKRVAVPKGSEFKVFKVNITKALEREELGDWVYFEPFEPTDFVQGTCGEAMGEATCDLTVWRSELGDLVITRADGEGPEYFGDEAVSEGLVLLHS
jgi:hypothetical protein